MKKPHTIIYIPGLGDRRLRGQGAVLKLWRFYNVNTKIYPILWDEKGPLSGKFTDLLNTVDSLAEKGHKVSLVGVSAGASTALSVFAKRPESINGVVCICGKIQNSQSVHPATYKANPRFRESMRQLDKLLPNLTKSQLKKVLSIHPLGDNTVPPKDTKIPGSYEKTIPTFGHVFSIAYSITVGSFGIVRFLKELARQR